MSQHAAPSVPGWFGVLLAARRVSHAGARAGRGAVFTAQDLAIEVSRAGNGAPPSLKEVNEASAWCSKFRQWGYLEIDKDATDAARGGARGRPPNLWKLTDYGLRRERPAPAISALLVTPAVVGMLSEKGWGVRQISNETGAPERSVSTYLRDWAAADEPSRESARAGTIRTLNQWLRNRA